MKYADFLDRVSQKAGLQRKRAEVATQAVLSVLGERISEKEVRDLASELPRELKRMLENVRGHCRGYLASEFVRLVAEGEGVPEADARVHTRAVLSTVREAVSRGELGDVLAELWRDPEYEELWAAPAAESRAPMGMGGDDVRFNYDEFLSRDEFSHLAIEARGGCAG
jgi:uncharacterized protein (DUF2267 family)